MRGEGQTASLSVLALPSDAGRARALGDVAASARRLLRPFLSALILVAAYFVATRLGLALRFQYTQIAVLWPANAVLLAALLLAPRRYWWLVVALTAFGHFAGMSSEVPAWRIAWQIAMNSALGLTSAAVLRRTTTWPLDFASRRQVFLFTAVSFGLPAIFAPTTAGFVRAMLHLEPNVGLAASSLRIALSNTTAFLLIVPPVILWAHRGFPRSVTTRRALEAVALTLGFAVTGELAFGTDAEIARLPSLLLWIIPPMLWAAVRFGPVGLSTSLLGVAALSIWSTAHHLGPFGLAANADQVLSLQLFWIVLGPPTMLLAALIREREETEEALRRSENRFANAFRSNPYGAVITRLADGYILEVNERFESLVGWRRRDIVGRRIMDLGIVGEGVGSQLRRLMTTAGGLHDVSLAMHDSSGVVREAMVSTEPVEVHDEACLIATFRDVTDQRRAEREARDQRDQLAHVIRVATVGELSGALAHDLRQPLMSILANAQAALRVLGRHPVDLALVREILEDIVEQDKQAGGVIARLRSFLKEGESRFEPLMLENVVRDALSLARSAIVISGADVQVAIPADLPRVRGDAVQMLQVMLNLLVNACEAMSTLPPSGRRLRLQAAETEGGRVHVSIADRGVGLPRGDEDLVFQPFFTTKEKGLGLGLAICRSIATAHGGRLWAENNPQGGATFHLLLPADNGHAERAAADSNR